MAFIERFEDIKAWQEARILTRQIYQLSDEGALAKDFGLRDQMRRASVSAMTNIAEGFDCHSNKSSLAFWKYLAAQQLKSNHCCTRLWILAILIIKFSIVTTNKPPKQNV